MGTYISSVGGESTHGKLEETAKRQSKEKATQIRRRKEQNRLNCASLETTSWKERGEMLLRFKKSEREREFAVRTYNAASRHVVGSFFSFVVVGLAFVVVRKGVGKLAGYLPWYMRGRVIGR